MRNKKLYNYLVNTFEISKKNVMEHVHSRVDELLEKHIKDFLEFNRFLDAGLNHLIRKIENNHYLQLDNIIQRYIQKEVEKRLHETYTFYTEVKCNKIHVEKYPR